ncbi:Protein CBG06251 [Caenorhabditis briggsae]|nr:Protein CBG06251 [Caenorhabditis briggsae]CAP26153.2 Protein CBG06251 [Caenorhabditis briggsae]
MKSYFQANFPLADGTIYMILVLVAGSFVYMKRMTEIKSEADLRVKMMSANIDELIQDHDEELLYEKKIAATHVIKMRMQKREFSSKLGGLQRKLKKQNETVNSLNSKLVSLEWAEEDANELVEEVMNARVKLRQKDELIEALKKQLSFYQQDVAVSSQQPLKPIQPRGRINQENIAP